MSSIILPKDFSLLTKEAINCHFLMALLFLLLSPGIINASDDSMHVGKHVIAAGGGISTSTEYVSKGTVGQTGIGRSLTNSYQVFSGFWKGAPQGCCINITGDLNSDGAENTILDLNFLVNQIFRGGPDPFCAEEGDLDGNGLPSRIFDLNVMVNKIFRGGANPAPCS